MIEITVSGLEGLREKLDNLEAALDAEAILDEAEALLLNRVRARFLDETDPDGVKWKPSVRAIKTGGKTLFKTGTLFHSIQAHSNGPGERAISTDVPYGKYHQFGVGKMYRPFLGFNNEDLTLAERLVLLRIEEALK